MKPLVSLQGFIMSLSNDEKGRAFGAPQDLILSEVEG